MNRKEKDNTSFNIFHISRNSGLLWIFPPLVLHIVFSGCNPGMNSQVASKGQFMMHQAKIRGFERMRKSHRPSTINISHSVIFLGELRNKMSSLYILFAYVYVILMYNISTQVRNKYPAALDSSHPSKVGANMCRVIWCLVSGFNPFEHMFVKLDHSPGYGWN